MMSVGEAVLKVINPSDLCHHGTDMWFHLFTAVAERQRGKVLVLGCNFLRFLVNDGSLKRSRDVT